MKYKSSIIGTVVSIFHNVTHTHVAVNEPAVTAAANEPDTRKVS